jgi:large subunit ribosomal protein L25
LFELPFLFISIRRNIMSESFEVNAVSRADQGKGASRRLRRDGKVPGVIYGAGKDPVAIMLEHNELLHHLENEAFYSHILDVSVDGTAEQAILKDMQRHPSKPIVMHVDFLRVDPNAKLRVNVPLHFINEDQAPGVDQGGLVTHSLTEVAVLCLPKDLPEFIEADLAALEMDATYHLSDITMPAGVELVELAHGEGHDQTVAAIHMPRAAKEEEEAPAEEAGEAPAAEEGGE